MPGYIYILSNPAMPELLKIGQTSELPENRIKQLNTTGVPSPFILECCFHVTEPQDVEKIVHERLAEFRHSSNREFFITSVKQALEAIFPIVCAHLADSPEPPASSKATVSHELNKDELYVLQLLVYAGSNAGISQFRLEHNTNMDRLALEIVLSKLFSCKFVSRRREAGNETRWICTPQGVKFLSDFDLIPDWMRNRELLLY